MSSDTYMLIHLHKIFLASLVKLLACGLVALEIILLKIKCNLINFFQRDPPFSNNLKTNTRNCTNMFDCTPRTISLSHVYGPHLIFKITEQYKLWIFCCTVYILTLGVVYWL